MDAKKYNRHSTYILYYPWFTDEAIWAQKLKIHLASKRNTGSQLSPKSLWLNPVLVLLHHTALQQNKRNMENSISSTHKAVGIFLFLKSMAMCLESCLNFRKGIFCTVEGKIKHSYFFYKKWCEKILLTLEMFYLFIWVFLWDRLSFHVCILQAYVLLNLESFPSKWVCSYMWKISWSAI